MKKFQIREVETVKTTAAMYECRMCFPDWYCDLIEGPQLPQDGTL